MIKKYKSSRIDDIIKSQEKYKNSRELISLISESDNISGSEMSKAFSDILGKYMRPFEKVEVKYTELSPKVAQAVAYASHLNKKIDISKLDNTESPGATDSTISYNTDPNAPTPEQIDPKSGMKIEPITNLLIDPDTQLLIDPSTGALFTDPQTGFPIDAKTKLPKDMNYGLLVDLYTGNYIDPTDDNYYMIDSKSGQYIVDDNGKPVPYDFEALNAALSADKSKQQDSSTPTNSMPTGSQLDVQSQDQQQQTSGGGEQGDVSGGTGNPTATDALAYYAYNYDGNINITVLKIKSDSSVYAKLKELRYLFPYYGGSFEVGITNIGGLYYPVSFHMDLESRVYVPNPLYIPHLEKSLIKLSAISKY